MPTPNVFPNHSPGDSLPAADWDTSFALVETSLLDLGAYVASGLVLSAGSGLSVNITSGHAVIGADITYASGAASSLTNNTTNHIYGLQDGTFTKNTTGTAPANSVKLGTCVTLAGVVSSVAMGRTSGRQQFVQPQNLVMGGPAAGTTSAGHPDALNLANWNLTDIEGKSCFGTLPDGAHSANVALVNAANVFSNASGNLFQVSDAGTANGPTALTVAHRTSGTPTTNFGAVFAMRSDNAANALADQLVVTTLWSSPTAGSENSVATFSIRRAGADVEVFRLTSAGNGRAQFAQDVFHTNASGSWGVFGVGPVVRQAGASAAGVASIADAATKAALTAIQAALAAYGWVTSPA